MANKELPDKSEELKQIEENQMSMMDHLKILKNKVISIFIFLVVVFGVSFAFIETIIDFLKKPLYGYMIQFGSTDTDDEGDGSEKQGIVALVMGLFTRDEVTNTNQIPITYETNPIILIDTNALPVAETSFTQTNVTVFAETNTQVLAMTAEPTNPEPVTTVEIEDDVIESPEDLVVDTVLPTLNSTGEFTLYYFKPQEKLITHLKVAFFLALLLSIPFALIQLTIYIFPALTRKERRTVVVMDFVVPVLFFFGTVLSYAFIAPTAFRFLMNYSSGDNVLPLWGISEYMNFVITLIIAIGVVFLGPLVLIALVNLSILSVEKLVKARRLAIVIMFIVAAILTPPDVVTQVIVGTLLMLLYEVTIIVSKVIERRRKRSGLAVAEGDEDTLLDDQSDEEVDDEKPAPVRTESKPVEKEVTRKEAVRRTVRDYDSFDDDDD